MAFVRRFCASFDFGHHRTTRPIAKWIACAAHTSSHSHLSSPVPTAHWPKCPPHHHVFFASLPRPADAHQRGGAWRRSPLPGERGERPSPPSPRPQERWHSLHWDRRDSSLMCLTDTARCTSVVPQPSDARRGRSGENPSFSKDLAVADPPVLFAIERGTASHKLSALTSTLTAQESLREVTATLRGLTTAVQLQSVLAAAARPWNQDSSDDIIIRRPIRSHGPSDIISSRPIGRCDYGGTSQPSNQGGASSPCDSAFSERVTDAHTHCTHRSVHATNTSRRHLYFNTFDDIAATVDLARLSLLQPMTSVPSVTSVLSVARDSQPSTARVDSSLNEADDSSPSPHSHEDSKPSKEQILVMYDRLASEMPNFLRESHDFSMYANTVVFDNRIMKFKTKGLPAYKLSTQSLKTACTLGLVGSSMEVLRLTAELELGVIHARWRLKGVPLHSYFLTPWRRKPRYFDALSTFQLGADGLIHCHKLDKVMPTPSDKVRAPSIATRIGIALGLVRNPSLSPNCMVPKPLSFLQAAKTNAHKL